MGILGHGVWSERTVNSLRSCRDRGVEVRGQPGEGHWAALGRPVTLVALDVEHQFCQSSLWAEKLLNCPGLSLLFRPCFQGQLWPPSDLLAMNKGSRPYDRCLSRATLK